MVEIAAENGITVTSDEVRCYLRQMDEDDDFEMNAVALAAIAGGKPHRKGSSSLH